MFRPGLCSASPAVSIQNILLEPCVVSHLPSAILLCYLFQECWIPSALRLFSSGFCTAWNGNADYDIMMNRAIKVEQNFPKEQGPYERSCIFCSILLLDPLSAFEQELYRSGSKSSAHSLGIYHWWSATDSRNYERDSDCGCCSCVSTARGCIPFPLRGISWYFSWDTLPRNPLRGNCWLPHLQVGCTLLGFHPLSYVVSRLTIWCIGL